MVWDTKEEDVSMTPFNLNVEETICTDLEKHQMKGSTLSKQKRVVTHNQLQWKCRDWPEWLNTKENQLQIKYTTKSFTTHPKAFIQRQSVFFY